MKLLDLIYVITLKNIFNSISIELQLVYDWINCFIYIISLLFNSFIDGEFLIFNVFYSRFQLSCFS